MSDKLAHCPVLLNEVLNSLKPHDNGVYVDCTLGAGSYTRAILRSANCKVIGIDQDCMVSVYVEKIKAEFGNRFEFVNDNFMNISNVLSHKVNGVVFDIGVSSMQLENADRGFSFMRDGALDMRMNVDSSLSAYDVVNGFSEKELSDIIYQYGEERMSRKIAKAIVDKRLRGSIKTTLELSRIIESVVPRAGKIHQATKTFQAIRIYVNNELYVLRQGLVNASKVLEYNGVIVVVSFHGLECRVVKGTFGELVNGMFGDKFEFVNKKSIVASRDEVLNNPRSRSARLRAIKKC